MLNSILPQLGTGYWSSIYANSGRERTARSESQQRNARRDALCTHIGDLMEPYTSGYNSDINVLARRWLKELRAQCDYGNDYVTHGTRFVAGVQQAQVSCVGTLRPEVS